MISRFLRRHSQLHARRQSGKLLLFAIFYSMMMSGCSQDGLYSLRVNFPNQELLEDTDLLFIWVVDEESCAKVDWGVLRISGENSLSSLVIENPSEFLGEMPVLDAVPNGFLAFALEGRTDSGAIILQGCTRVEVKAGATIEVRVDLTCVCEPIPGTCAPVDEMVGNGIDDDCDGETDECSSALDCDDENGCTQDLCIMSQCQHTPWPDTTRCTDMNDCTSNDSCQSGICVGQQKDCSQLDESCVEGVCNQETGQCETRHRDELTPCDDGLFCTVDDACHGGVCLAGGERNCSDEEPCTRDFCNENERACRSIWEPMPGEEGPPGDANCSDGIDNDCDNLVDEEDPDCLPCVAEDCDDGNICTSNTCVENVCVTEATNENGSCSDGYFCTVDDVCVAGVCQGQPRVCVAGDSCHFSVCSEADSCCMEQVKEDGENCDDGLFCTVQDVCASGFCVGQDRDCGDDDICTADECDEELNVCLHTRVQIPGGEGPRGSPTCGNGVDDDCDGWVDLEDPDCGFRIEVIKAQTAPQIDGNCVEYVAAQSVNMISIDGWSSTLWFMWDQTALYICMQASDNSIDVVAVDPESDRDGDLWDDDSIEILFDVDNDGGSNLTVGDYKFWVNAANVQCDTSAYDKTWSIAFLSAVVLNGSLNNDTDVDDGYTIEVALPWAEWGVATPLAGELWGGDLKLNDRDSVEQVEGLSVIWANTDGGSVNTPDGFGDWVFLE